MSRVVGGLSKHRLSWDSAVFSPNRLEVGDDTTEHVSNVRAYQQEDRKNDNRHQNQDKRILDQALTTVIETRWQGDRSPSIGEMTRLSPNSIRNRCGRQHAGGTKMTGERDITVEDLPSEADCIARRS